MAIVDFFLGSTSSEGYISLFKHAAQPPIESFLLKGTPGSGKSAIIKKICSHFETNDERVVEKIHCAQTPDSLDGVLYNKEQVSVLDATAPHSFEAIYPIVAGTEISLYDCVNPNRVIEHKEQVIESSNQISMASIRCKNFLQARYSIVEENRNLILENMDIAKVQRLAHRLKIKEMPNQNGVPKEHKRMLSAVTPDGLVTYESTVHRLCEKIYVIKDEHTCASSILLSLLRLYALETGQEFYTCLYPIEGSNKIEHLIFPDLGTAFVTSHRYNDFSFQPYRTINYTRFTDMSAVKKHKQRISFHRKAADELFKEAVALLDFQKEHYDILKDIYINATDFDCVNIIMSRLVNRLAGRI